MTVAEVKALPVREKLQIMEAIWEDFRERFEKADISENQKRLLDETQPVKNANDAVKVHIVNRARKGKT